MEKIRPKLVPAGFADDMPNFSAFDLVTHPGVSGEALSAKRFEREKAEGKQKGFTGELVIFDRAGRIVFQGVLKESELEPFVLSLLKQGGKEPRPIDVGQAPYVQLASQARRVASGGPLGGPVKELEALLASEGKPADLIDEARRLQEAIKASLDAEEALLVEMARDDPDYAKGRLAQRARELAGTALGSGLDARTREFVASPGFAAAVEFRKIRDALGKFGSCQGCKAFRQACGDCRQRNARGLAAQRRKLEDLLARCAELPIRPAVQACLDALAENPPG